MTSGERPRALRDYLFGTLEPGEREWLERSLLTDDDLYQELLVVEDELVDDYVLDRLERDEAHRLREYLFRLPDGRTKLAFAKAMRVHADRGASSASRGRWTAMRPWLLTAAAALVLGMGGLFILDAWNPLRRDAAGAPAVGEPTIAGANTEREARPAPGASVPALLLQPGTMRGGGERARMARSAEPSLVEIHLDLASDDYDAYRAGILDADLVERLAFGALRPDVGPERIRIRLLVATHSLPPGDYLVSLSGIDEGAPATELEPVARYEFRVTPE